MKLYLIFNSVWATVRVTSKPFAEEIFFRFIKGHVHPVTVFRAPKEKKFATNVA